MLILNRTACLGGDVTQLKIGTNHDFNNQQKVRVDLFMDYINGKELKPNLNILSPLLLMPQDVYGIYSQSEELKWLKINEKPSYLFMDNFSELVDKKITHKDGWSFGASYGDLDPECFKNGILIDKGLLAIDKIYESYDLFFQFIKEMWDVPIIFMHFPTIFDDREIYIKQGNAITLAINDLSFKYNIQDIHADLDSIERFDNNYYHFGFNTIKNMANKILI